MRPALFALVVVPVMLAGWPASADSARALRCGFGQEGWHTFADAPWWSLVDIRDMLNVFHPFVLSRTGAAAGAWRDVTLPADWKPPFALRFYCADDYFADAEKHKPGQKGTESFFEHRFKQVLVNDTVVWERDVVDENVHGSQTLFEVDLTPYVSAGKSFRLTFRAFDRVSTEVRNARDVWFIGGTWYAAGDGVTEQPPRFHTAVWFADPVAGEAQAVAVAPGGVRPHEAAVAERHRKRWPMPPPGDRMRSPARLSLVAPSRIPAPGFPLTCGLPLSPGLLRDGRAVRLRDAAGTKVPVQSRTTGFWPNGSARWVLLKAVLPAGASPADRFEVRLGEGREALPRVRASVSRSEGGTRIRTGPIRVDLGADAHTLVEAVTLAGRREPLLTDLRSRMVVRIDGVPVPVAATWREAKVVERGPVCVCVELHGSLDTAQRHIGRFVFRLYAYAGLPTVQVSFRVFNDVKPEPYHGMIEDAPLEVTDLALVATVPERGRGATVFGVVGGDSIRREGERVRLLQEASDRFTVESQGTPQTAGARAQGWMAVTSSRGCVHASVWRFWQQYPKALLADGDRLEIGLFTPAEGVPAYTPRFGEAKRHDVWLTFASETLSTEACTALGRLADEPPRLFDGEWFCRTGAVNVLDPEWFRRYPQLRAYAEKAYGDVSTARVTGQFGIRNFGDMPYTPPQWLNGYWAMVQGALNWGLASGDPRWLERSFEIARHIADVDTVHIPPGHPDVGEWDGVTCALSPDHSVHMGLSRWPAFQIGESLLLHHWMTGDPDSREAGLANADYIVRSGAGFGSAEARSQARPLLTLLRAWQATADTRYRDAARRYLDLRTQRERVIEWRRGAYIQPTYENWRCISAGLDSMYASNIYEYYRLTGDVDAAQMVVAIADSIYAESMLPQEEGIGSFLFYVRYSRNAWYYPQMALLFHMAYDLTGDLRFLRAGRAAFARYLLCKDGAGNPMYQPFHNFGWLDPELGGWLRRFEHIPTQPFRITSQTPDPDPAQYQ